MRKFIEYLESASPYLECCAVGRTTHEEKKFFKRIVEENNLEKEFSSKVKEDPSWQNLAEKEVFYFVDIVNTKRCLLTSKVDPEIRLLKLELGDKAVIKLMVDATTVQNV